MTERAWQKKENSGAILFSLCFIGLTITAIAQTAPILSASSVMFVSGTRNFASRCNW